MVAKLMFFKRHCGILKKGVLKLEKKGIDELMKDFNFILDDESILIETSFFDSRNRAICLHQNVKYNDEDATIVYEGRDFYIKTKSANIPLNNETASKCRQI